MTGAAGGLVTRGANSRCLVQWSARSASSCCFLLVVRASGLHNPRAGGTPAPQERPPLAERADHTSHPAERFGGWGCLCLRSNSNPWSPLVAAASCSFTVFTVARALRSADRLQSRGSQSSRACVHA